MNFEQIHYANTQHKDHYLAFVTTNQSNDSSYLSAYYILTSTKEIWAATKRYTTPDTIDFDKMIGQGFPSAYKSLILLAQHLYMASPSFDLDQALATWDQTSYSIALQAIKLRWTLSRENAEQLID